MLLRCLDVLSGSIRKDYPFIHTSNKSIYLLAIYPDYHTKLFPDSILKNEDPNIIEDVSYTNTIHKVYIAKLALTRLKRGDIVVIYRTTDIKGRARFRSVVSSVCVVEEAKSRKDFLTVDDFIKFAAAHSIFSEADLRARYADGERLYALRMTYNAAFGKRTTRGTLLDDVGIPEHPRWDLKPITHKQFARIIQLGKVNENLIVD